MTAITCGEATIRLLQQYGVRTVFGIPGVHTLDFCRGLARPDTPVAVLAGDGSNMLTMPELAIVIVYHEQRG